MIYMISYDLKSPTNNREAVEQSIKDLGSWCKYLTTTFLVSSTLSHDDVEKRATKYLDSNDRMIICKTEKPIKGWLDKKEWNWINENL